MLSSFSSHNATMSEIINMINETSETVLFALQLLEEKLMVCCYISNFLSIFLLEVKSKK